MKQVRKVYALIACTPVLTVLLSACAINEPARLRASEGSILQGQSVALFNQEGEDGLRENFRTALHSAFEERAAMVDESGTLIADFGISVQDARVGQVLDPGGDEEAQNEEVQNIDWQARPRASWILDGCEPVRASATLALFNRQTGEIAYRGEAESIVCEENNIDVISLADQLVGDAARADELSQP